MNDDCLLWILSYLPVDDLNAIAICNQRCRRIRAHESLAQTRKGTIVISEECSCEDFMDAMIENGWNNDFQHNRTHLEIVGMERLRGVEVDVSRQNIARRKFTGVTSLDLKCNLTASNQRTD